MQIEQPIPTGELLRRAMRHWVTGVAIATSRSGEIAHGMTVNSFGSISLEPPLVTVTMNHNTRTLAMVEQSGVFAITVLARHQQALAELFAGRLNDHGDRMTGQDTFTLATGSPLLSGGIAFLDCRVVHQFDMPTATLYVGEVVAAQTVAEEIPPLVYHNRLFTQLG